MSKQSIFVLFLFILGSFGRTACPVTVRHNASALGVCMCLRVCGRGRRSRTDFVRDVRAVLCECDGNGSACIYRHMSFTN